MIAIGVCQICDTGSRATRGVQALVLSPTRELAVQHEKVILAIGDFLNIHCHCCIGGKSVGEDLRRLEGGGVHCVSGTPGRVFDMIRRKALETRGIKTMVLDEADEMLSLGFKDQIYDIYRYLPASVQVVLVSATLPREVVAMTSKVRTRGHGQRAVARPAWPSGCKGVRALRAPLSCCIRSCFICTSPSVLPGTDVRIILAWGHSRLSRRGRPNSMDLTARMRNTPMSAAFVRPCHTHSS